MIRKLACGTLWLAATAALLFAVARAADDQPTQLPPAPSPATQPHDGIPIDVLILGPGGYTPRRVWMPPSPRRRIEDPELDPARRG